MVLWTIIRAMVFHDVILSSLDQGGLKLDMNIRFSYWYTEINFLLGAIKIHIYIYILAYELSISLTQQTQRFLRLRH